MNIFKSLFIGDKGKPLYGHAPIPPYPVGHNMIHCYRKERIMYNITFFDTQGIAVVNEDYEYDSYDNCEEYCKLVVTKNAFIRGYKISLSETAKQEIQEEFDNLMQAGIDEITDGNIDEIATEYFTDAAYVLNKIQDVEFKEYLEIKYPINPQDFAQ